MARYHGKVSTFKIDDTGATLQDLSGEVTDVSLDLTQDVAESTAKGDTAKTFTVGHYTGTMSISGRYEDTATTGPDAVFRELVTSMAASDFEVSFGGDAVSSRRVSGSCIITSYSVSSPLADTVNFTAAAQITGAVTFDTN